jgi:alpha-tubulin suppressor-like RCC1 family protein
MNTNRSRSRRPTNLTARCSLLAFAHAATLLAAGCTGDGSEEPADSGVDGSVDSGTDGGITEISWKSITAGGAHTCGIRTKDNALYCWGGNGYGQLGDGTKINRSIPTRIGDSAWYAIIAGEDFDGSQTCGIEEVGRKLYCWGRNGYGEVGDGTSGVGTEKITPAKISDQAWSELATGCFHTCALKADGKAYCWGYNYDGQIGDGTSGTGSDKTTPTKAGDGTWASITAGWHHTCGIKPDGSLYCWGYNESGQLGTGTTTNRSVPTRIGEDTWTAVTAGDKHTCALNAADNKIYCWGSNGWGQLGDENIASATEPHRMGDEPWSALSAGLFHTCGIRMTDKSLYCWGQNLSGQLGDGTQTDRFTPTKVSDDRWSAITAGYAHTCGIKETDNKLYCWGDNGYGKLGDGTATTYDEWGQIIENNARNVPTLVLEP